jgi:hypothetical protein
VVSDCALGASGAEVGRSASSRAVWTGLFYDKPAAAAWQTVRSPCAAESLLMLPKLVFKSAQERQES